MRQAPKLCVFLLVTLALLLLPLAAHGQWARSRTEHDWSVTIGGQSFGILQRSVDTTGAEWGWQRVTTIYMGAYTVTTRLRAGVVAMGLLLPIGLGGFLIVGLLPTRREKTACSTVSKPEEHFATRPRAFH